MAYIGKVPTPVPMDASDIPANSIDSSKILDGVITIDDVGINAVGTAELVNDAVTADKLANSINTDIATGVTGNTTANAALPKAGGTMTGNLNVNHPSSWASIVVNGGGGSESTLQLSNYGNLGSGSKITSTGDAPLRIGTNSTDQVWITSAGDVGIGTSSPTKKIEVAGDIQLDASDASIWLKSGAAGTIGRVNWTYNTNDTVYAYMGLDYDTRATIGFELDSAYPITIDGTSNIMFDLAGSEKMRIQNNGNVGIGTNSPTSNCKLHISDTDTQIELEATTGANSAFVDFDGINLQIATNRNQKDGAFSNTGKSNATISLSGASGGSDIKLYTASANNTTGTERMRIDASGNVLVGTTVQYGANGATIQNNGMIYSRRTDGSSVYLRRDGTDGDIIYLEKAGTKVGTIGINSDQLLIDSGATGRIELDNTLRVIASKHSGQPRLDAVTDAATDLGATNNRFKNLYLSSGVMAGNIYSYGVSASNTVRPRLKTANGTDFPKGTCAMVYLYIMGTGTPQTDQVFRVGYQGGGTSNIQYVSGSSRGVSNRPNMSIDSGGYPIIFTGHGATYTLKITVVPFSVV